MNSSTLAARLDADPWERMPGEQPRAYRAFCAYRDMAPLNNGKRSTHAVGRQLSMSKQWVERCCTQWRWVDRAVAWDDEQDRINRETQLEAIREMNDFHARIARQIMQRVAVRIMGGNLNGQDVPALDPGKLSPMDISRLIDVAAKLERLARGVPSDVIGEAKDRENERDLGRIARGLLANPTAMEKALDSLDALADSDVGSVR